MEAFLASIVAGVVANTLSGFLKPDRLAELGKRSRIIKDAIRGSAAQRSTYSRAYDEFVATEEFRLVVRAMASSVVLERPPLLKQTQELHDTFLACMQVPGTSAEHAESFQTLVRAVEHHLNETFPPKREGPRWQGVSLDLVEPEADNIVLLLEFLKQERPDLRAIQRFYLRLREEIRKRHDTLVPPHFDSRIPVPIEKIYVRQRFHESGASELNDPMLHDELFFPRRRTVVLGNPGSGKSTLVRWLAFQYSSSPWDVLGGHTVIPFPAVIRYYEEYRKEFGPNLLGFLVDQAERYQKKIPAHAIEYLLRSGVLAVFFDGLDEVLNPVERAAVVEEIESFSREYSAAPIVVTSRIIGYAKAPLDDREFDRAHISEFDDAQVSEYVGKWFAAVPTLDAAETARIHRQFMRDSENIREIRANPLVLSLLCNIYRGERYIPNNKPAVYGKCAEMLYERFDRLKGLDVRFPYDTHLRPVVQDIAYELLEMEHQSGVGEAQMLGLIRRSLLRSRTDDEDEAQATAKDFLDFCKDRAWVLTEMGKSQTEPLYDFTHRTFQEYFAACYLSFTCRTPQELLERLGSRVVRGEWDQISQIAFHLSGLKHGQVADELVLGLLAHIAPATVPNRERRFGFSFLSRVLAFMPVERATLRSVISAFLEHLTIDSDFDDGGDETLDGAIILAELFDSPIERRQLSLEMTVGLLEKAISGGDEMRTARLLSTLRRSIRILNRRSRSEVATFVSRSLDASLTRCSESFGALVRKSADVAAEACEVDSHFLPGTFTAHGIRMLHERLRPIRVTEEGGSLFWRLLLSLEKSEVRGAEDRELYWSLLSDATARKVRVPKWRAVPQLNDGQKLMAFVYGSRNWRPEIRPRQIAAIWIALAPFWELEATHKEFRTHVATEIRNLSGLQFVMCVLSGRFEARFRTLAVAELHRRRLSQATRETMEDWMKGRVSFRRAD